MVRRIRILQGLQTGAASSAETNSGRLSVRIIGWPQVGLEEVGALSEWSAIRTEVKPRALSPSRASSRRSSRAHLSRRGNGLAICGQHSLRSRKAVNFVETCRSITQGPRTPPNHSLVSGAMVQITPQHIQFIFPGTVPRFGTASDANPVRIERCPTKRTLWTARSIRLRPKPLRVTRSSPPATPDRTSGGRTHRRAVPLINIEAKRDPTCRAQMLESLGYLPVSGYRSAPVQVCRRRCTQEIRGMATERQPSQARQRWRTPPGEPTDARFYPSIQGVQTDRTVRRSGSAFSGRQRHACARLL
jgi:hypothetical protein